MLAPENISYIEKGKPLSMHSRDIVKALPRGASLTLALLLLGSLLLSACGGDPQVRQQESQKQAQFASLLQYAQQIGVPMPLLQPIIRQEQALSHSTAPFELFSDQSITTYYRNLDTRYSQLEVQLRALITTATAQLRTQAQQDVQNLQSTMTRLHAQNLPTQNFAQSLSQSQALLTKARDPKDYAAISGRATASLSALVALQTTSAHLATLKSVIDQLQQSHIDVTVLLAQYQSDQTALTQDTQSRDFQQLDTLVAAQYQQAVVNTTQAIPYITAARLGVLAQQIKQLQTYGIDPTPYQKKLNADRAMLNKTLTVQDFQIFSKQVDADISSMQADLVRGQAQYLVRQFHQEAGTWSNAHLYHDSFDGHNYPLDAGYLPQGIGSDLDLSLSWASTTQDFQNVLNEAQNDLFNLRMLEADYNDHTPYNQAHATDTQILGHYGLQQGQVLVVSMVEQTMRVYQDGKLVNAFQVTTGRAELPALPGVWTVLGRQSPTVFKSPEPPGSPYWYPDTPIHYAILYHYGGYFVHDSWWRADYGPGTQFPHYDSGGDESFAGNGSHGCVNVREDQAAWLYSHTDWNTRIVLY